jgi:hypothetical protein
VEWLAKKYNVREDKVLAVIHELGVEPENIIDSASEASPFPVSYIGEKIAEVKDHQGYITKQQIHSYLSSGYELRCEDQDALAEYYIFYSMNLSPSLFDKEQSLVVRFIYRQSENNEMMLDQARTFSNLRDSGFASDRRRIKDLCLGRP